MATALQWSCNIGNSMPTLGVGMAPIVLNAGINEIKITQKNSRNQEPIARNFPSPLFTLVCRVIAIRSPGKIKIRKIFFLAILVGA
jgi:hypothetical protein